jgi:hypothetical protein
MNHIDQIFEKIGNDFFNQICKKFNIMDREELAKLVNHMKTKYPLLWSYYEIDTTESNLDNLDDIEKEKYITATQLNIMIHL